MICLGTFTKIPRVFQILRTLIPCALSTMSKAPRWRLATLMSRNGTILFLVLVADFVLV